jgi:hypothetical protein
VRQVKFFGPRQSLSAVARGLDPRIGGTTTLCRFQANRRAATVGHQHDVWAINTRADDLGRDGKRARANQA